MLNPDALVLGGKLDPEAVAAAAADAGLARALAAPRGDLADAGLAIAAGLAARADIPALVALLDRDDLAGQAAAWALARLDAEAATLAAIAEGGIDLRTNGYLSLATRIALGKASPGLGDALAGRIADEIARARAKRTGLGDQALRGLAMLGDARCTDLIQQVQDADPYTDKFELQRLRKAVADGGRDGESIADLRRDWTEIFAEHLAVPAEAVPVADDAGTAADADAARSADADADADPADLPADGTEAGAGVPPAPIDWKAFLASPEAAALPEKVRPLAGQLGPLLEQLAVRAIGAALTDLSGQELAALLLQVLPQALPPQHVQAALSPQALHAYQAMAKYFASTGQATHGEDLLAGVKLVRQQLQAQIRASGMLGGPDYSDPDEAKPVTKA